MTEAITDRTPVLVGWGQCVERDAGDDSPMDLAARASSRALSDCGNGQVDSSELARAIDTICVVKLFSDMAPLWAGKWGRSDNPPQSVAKRIGANPRHREYTKVGGDRPQVSVIEFAKAIANGERDMVLITGAEALKNQRHAERNGRTLDWNESFDEPLVDHGFGKSVATDQELKNGLSNVAFYYSLIEQAQRNKAGRSVDQHRKHMAVMLESFSQIAANNPYAQFSGAQTAEDIVGAAPITQLYSKRMIAQDGVNQAAALLLCSVGKAKALGIPESQWVYMHGMAQGEELEVSRRPDPSRSPVAEAVADHCLSMAGLNISQVSSLDIYSCFPCAVTAVAQHLKLPQDGRAALTTTGGLPYFGGPGNNYSMHAIAEAMKLAREHRTGYHMITANGGVLSKHAAGIYSCKPSNINWSNTTTEIDLEQTDARVICEAPSQGTIVSHTVHFGRNGEASGIVLADTPKGERFVAVTAKGDVETPARLLNEELTGAEVRVADAVEGRLDFKLV